MLNNTFSLMSSNLRSTFNRTKMQECLTCWEQSIYMYYHHWYYPCYVILLLSNVIEIAINTPIFCFFFWSHHQTNSQLQSNLFQTQRTHALTLDVQVSANRSWVSWRCRSVVLNTQQRLHTLRQSRSNHAWGQYLPLTAWKLVQIPRQKRGLLYNV